MSKVQLCRFCCEVEPAHWWCERKQRCLSEDEMSVPNHCGGFRYNPLDAITLKQNYPSVVARLRRERREKALYEKRMRGDWS